MISLCLRTAWTPERVSGQPGLQSDTLSQNKQSPNHLVRDNLESAVGNTQGEPLPPGSPPLSCCRRWRAQGFKASQGSMSTPFSSQTFSKSIQVSFLNRELTKTLKYTVISKKDYLLFFFVSQFYILQTNSNHSKND